MKRCFRTCVDRVVKEPILEHLRHFEFSEEEDEIDCHIGPDAEEELKNYEYYHLDDYTTISKILKLLAGWLDQMKTLPEHAVLDHPPVLPSEQTVTNCNFTNKGFSPFLLSKMLLPLNLLNHNILYHLKDMTTTRLNSHIMAKNVRISCAKVMTKQEGLTICFGC